MHNPKSATERLTLPRKQGGRGLIDITNLNNKQINYLRQYFRSKSEISQLHKTVILVDAKDTSLNLQVSEIPQKQIKSYQMQITYRSGRKNIAWKVHA
jgi:hypothetical protein